MEKIKKLFGFEEKKYSWSTLDESLKKELIKRSGILIALFLINIYIVLSFKDLYMLCLFLLIDVAYAIFLYYTLLLFEYEKYITVEGTILKIVNETKTSRRGGISWGKCSMIIQVNNVLVEVPISISSKYKKGVRAKIYVLDKNVIQVETDYFKILSPLAISIIKTIDAYTLFNVQEEKEKNH